MVPTLLDVLPGFGPAFAAALLTNLGVAAAAMALSLAAGLPLAWLRLGPPPGPTPAPRLRAAGAHAAGVLAGLARAAPTFVVMFFLLNTLPARLVLGAVELDMTPAVAVTLALAVYGTAYVSDSGLEALRQWRAREQAAALLFVMGLLRAYYVMVLSSGFGAAIGLVEATAVTMRAAEALPRLADRVGLMALAVMAFVVLFQALYAATDALRTRLQRALALRR